MGRHITPFFATQSDLSKIVKTIAALRPLQFIIAGLFTSPEIQSFHCLTKPKPTENYLIADRNLKINIRQVPQKAGSHKYAIDQMLNPKTIVIRTGGIIKEKCLMAGKIGTISEDRTSIELYTLFSSKIIGGFEKIKSYYVGEDALRYLDRGFRLMATPKSPRQFDLTR
jgi:hypothetical protein